MALHYSREGYNFSAGIESLTIEPGPRPITLTRSELEQLGLAIREDFQVPPEGGRQGESMTAGILAALAQALRRLEGPANASARRHLRSAMVLIGSLDEKTALEILERNGA
ncbi:MAG: hypothetical protein ACE5JH_11650 [Acidobacteriota bacterium]